MALQNILPLINNPYHCKKCTENFKENLETVYNFLLVNMF